MSKYHEVISYDLELNYTNEKNVYLLLIASLCITVKMYCKSHSNIWISNYFLLIVSAFTCIVTFYEYTYIFINYMAKEVTTRIQRR